MRTKINKFGFEIEGEFSSTALSQLQTTDFRKLAEMTIDGSVKHCERHNQKDWAFHKNNPRSYSTRELVSIPFRFNKKGLAEAQSIFNLLSKNKNYHWNESSGFHIHFSFMPNPSPEISSTLFVNYFKNKLKKDWKEEYERRKNNRYCLIRPITESEIVRYHNINRYKFINYQSLAKHKTIEIRIFPANSPTAMYKYLIWTLQAVNDFLKRNLKMNRNLLIEIEEDITRRNTFQSEINLNKKQIKTYEN